MGIRYKQVAVAWYARRQLKCSRSSKGRVTHVISDAQSRVPPCQTVSGLGSCQLLQLWIAVAVKWRDPLRPSQLWTLTAKWRAYSSSCLSCPSTTIINPPLSQLQLFSIFTSSLIKDNRNHVFFPSSCLHRLRRQNPSRFFPWVSSKLFISHLPFVFSATLRDNS